MLLQRPALHVPLKLALPRRPYVLALPRLPACVAQRGSARTDGMVSAEGQPSGALLYCATVQRGVVLLRCKQR